MPRARHRSASPGWSLDDSIMMVAPPSRLSALIFSATAKPSMPGIIASSSTSGKPCGEPASAASAVTPSDTAEGRIRHRDSISCRIARLVVLSSTTSTGSPSRLTWRDAGASRGMSWTSRAALKEKVAPWPGVLSTQRRPPISATSCEEMVSPRPVPPNRRAVDVSAWLKAWKMSACLSSGIPGPVSATETCEQEFLRLGRAAGPHDDLARFGELDGVAHQVHQHLAAAAGDRRPVSAASRGPRAAPARASCGAHGGRARGWSRPAPRGCRTAPAPVPGARPRPWSSRGCR